MRKRIVQIVVLFIIILSFCGCSRKTLDIVFESTEEQEVDRLEKSDDGIFYNGITIQMSGVSTNTGKIYYSQLINPDFQVICDNPTCKHINKECSAYLNENVGDCSFLYKGKRIIFLTDSNSETPYTEVYEADEDGNNRVLKTTFNGFINDGLTTDVINNGKLYFTCFVKSHIVSTKDGVVTTKCDLELGMFDFEEYEYYDMKDFDEMPSNCGFDIFKSYDGKIYCRYFDEKKEATFLYLMNETDKSCIEKAKLEDEVGMIGVVDDNLIYIKYTDYLDTNIYIYNMETKENISNRQRETFDSQDFMIENHIGEKTAHEQDDGTYTMTIKIYNLEGELLEEHNSSISVMIIRQIGNILLNINNEGYISWVYVDDLDKVADKNVVLCNPFADEYQ